MNSNQVESTANSGNTHPPHMVVFMYPLQGHIIPTFHLAKKLASKGVVITLVCTEACHALITKAHNGRDPFSHAVARLGVPIRCAQVSDGLPLDFDRLSNNNEHCDSLLNKMEPHAEELIRRLEAEEESPLTCIIADTYFVWPHRVAKKFGLSYVSFWTQPVMVLSICLNWDLLRENRNYPFTGNEEEIINYIPGVPALKLTDLPSFLQDLDVTGPVHRLLEEAFKSAHAADCFISNTIHDMESSGIEQFQLQTGIPVWSAGPLLPPPLLGEQGVERYKDEVGATLWAESDCRDWLDSKAKNSVIYISFGSFAHVSKAQIEEMAMGLLESRQAFLWVLRPDIVASNVHDILPIGFLEDCRDQGLVVQWTSQIDALSHSAVGGFLTHCGWNSIMESLWLGVPMLGFPILGDQCTNCRLMEEEWGVAMRLGGRSRSLKNMRSELVQGKEIAKTVRHFMDIDGENQRKIRSNIDRVKLIMKTAAINGGSSDRNLDIFIHQMMMRNDNRPER